MKRYISLLISVLLVSMGISSQTAEHLRVPDPGQVSLGNVQVEIGPVLNIRYTLRFGEGVDWCRIGLFLSTDGGSSYSRLPDSEYITGDLGKISSGGDKSIKYDHSEVKQELAGKQLDFKVEVLSKNVIRREYLIAGTASVYPGLSYGLMVGTVRKTGFYIKARSNFVFPASSYSCNISGVMDSGGTIWANGSESRSRFVITGGMIYHASPWIYPYAGVGYGSKQLFLQDVQDNWAAVSDLSYKGVSLDAGLLLKIRKFVLSAGVCNTAFKYTEGEIGVGFLF